MNLRTFLSALSAALFLALPAAADDIKIHHGYAISSGPTAQTGGAYFVIHNMGADDRLIGVRSEHARRTELHTNEDAGDGVMKMRHVEEGFDVPAGAELIFKRGGHHVMFMGLNAPFVQDDELEIVLLFENAGEIAVTVPVDNDRVPMDHGAMDHGDMDHGDMDHDSMDHSAMDGSDG